MFRQLRFNIIYQTIDDIVIKDTDFCLFSQPGDIGLHRGVEVDKVAFSSSRVLDVEF